jgi:transposase
VEPVIISIVIIQTGNARRRHGRIFQKHGVGLLFTHRYARSLVFFDCTNYYFEIDLPSEDKQKGPSKENRHEPIIGQALLLDADLVPLAMQMYPGNESEKPYIRKMIQEMKERYKVIGKTVQVADKGLNCARNIYAAVVESDDGYIFSKSLHGNGLSEKEKQWLLLENDANVYTDYRDANGKLLFRLKSCVDTFSYKFKELDPETGKEKVIAFRVKEKRIVSYNPSLAKKQKVEILKMADKAANYTTYKKMAREDLGDSVKYVQVISTGKSGENVRPVVEINQTKIDEDLKYAGYNLLVTSELNMNPLQLYHIYHNLWKIEESFRITKSYLDARPVYVQKKETIYGHFLICYLSLFLLRVMEIKCFKNKINSYDLVNFMRDFRVVNKNDGTYINISQNQTVNEKIKGLIGLTNLDALYLTEKEIKNIFEYAMLIDN